MSVFCTGHPLRNQQADRFGARPYRRLLGNAPSVEGFSFGLRHHELNAGFLFFHAHNLHKSLDMRNSASYTSYTTYAIEYERKHGDTDMTIDQQIAAARNEVRKHQFGTAAYDAAFDAMRAITVALASNRTEEFCSIDSGIHRTRLMNGKVI